MQVYQKRSGSVDINTQNIITDLRSKKEELFTNIIEDFENLQDIEHQIDIELEEVNDMIEIEK